MASNRCTACASENTRVLSNMTPNRKLDYHRCNTCGHVWITFTDGRPPHHVTPLDQKPS
jgi:hypothetical protein